ncbi:hypothetical protein [Cohnella yongneupensis]|uniref:Uncharacterized protein n=1 Tax=Cohnella yongneupensis TaxID=425006 RepID=A0ABW0R9G9_9BACL
MSYKPIDIQTSLPRTIELTPLAQQHQQRAVNEQTALGQQSVKHAEQESKRSQKTESSAKGSINDREARERGKRSGSAKPRKPDEQEPEASAKSSAHPYKGKHIDFMG